MIAHPFQEMCQCVLRLTMSVWYGIALISCVAIDVEGAPIEPEPSSMSDGYRVANTCATDGPDADGFWPIDVMVAYTDLALAEAGGFTKLKDDVIDKAAEEANESYLMSGIKQKLYIRAITKVTYAETSSTNQALTALKNGTITDTQGRAVTTLRDDYRADVVVVLVKCIPPQGEPDDACPSSVSDQNINPPNADKAFSVVLVHEATEPNYSFTHELGHVMGANHDWVDTSVENTVIYNTGYNHGHVQSVTSPRWATIMGYCRALLGCTRILRWSDPNRTWLDGKPMGSSREDNVRMLNEMLNQQIAPNIANFRCHRPSLQPCPPSKCPPSPPSNMQIR